MLDTRRFVIRADYRGSNVEHYRSHFFFFLLYTQKIIYSSFTARQRSFANISLKRSNNIYINILY